MKKWISKNWLGLLVTAFIATSIAASTYDDETSNRKIVTPYRFDRDTAVNSDTDNFVFGGATPYVIDDGNYYYSVHVENDELSGTATTTYYVQASNAASGDYWSTIATSSGFTDDGDTIMSGQFYGARLRVQRVNSGTSTAASDIIIKMTPIN